MGRGSQKAALQQHFVICCRQQHDVDKPRYTRGDATSFLTLPAVAGAALQRSAWTKNVFFHLGIEDEHALVFAWVANLLVEPRFTCDVRRSNEHADVASDF